VNAEFLDKVIVQINEKYYNEIVLAGSLFDFILIEIRKKYMVFHEFYDIDKSISQPMYETEVLRMNILLMAHVKKMYKV